MENGFCLFRSFWLLVLGSGIGGFLLMGFIGMFCCGLGIIFFMFLWFLYFEEFCRWEGFWWLFISGWGLWRFVGGLEVRSLGEEDDVIFRLGFFWFKLVLFGVFWGVLVLMEFVYVLGCWGLRFWLLDGGLLGIFWCSVVRWWSMLVWKLL